MSDHGQRSEACSEWWDDNDQWKPHPKLNILQQGSLYIYRIGDVGNMFAKHD